MYTEALKVYTSPQCTFFRSWGSPGSCWEAFETLIDAPNSSKTAPRSDKIPGGEVYTKALKVYTSPQCIFLGPWRRPESCWKRFETLIDVPNSSQSAPRSAKILGGEVYTKALKVYTSPETILGAIREAQRAVGRLLGPSLTLPTAPKAPLEMTKTLEGRCIQKL